MTGSETSETLKPPLLRTTRATLRASSLPDGFRLKAAYKKEPSLWKPPVPIGSQAESAGEFEADRWAAERGELEADVGLSCAFRPRCQVL